MPPEAFDVYAPVYDAHFTQSRIGKAQRKRVHQLVRPLLKNCTSVLELNCGTGEDAVWLAKQGLHVHATDSSEGMIAEANRKCRPELALTFSPADLRSPEQLPTQIAGLIFSDFGGLNCLSAVSLKRLATALHSRLATNGKLAVVVMGRNCWWEKFYFGLKGDARANRRKSTSGVPTTIGEARFLTWYYSPDEFATHFASGFSVTQVAPVGLFIPPSYLEPFFAKKRFLFSLCVVFDRLFAHGRWLADTADHYLIVFEKRSV